MNRQVIMDALKTSKVKIDFRSLNSNRNITGIYTCLLYTSDAADE